MPRAQRGEAVELRVDPRRRAPAHHLTAILENKEVYFSFQVIPATDGNGVFMGVSRRLPGEDAKRALNVRRPDTGNWARLKKGEQILFLHEAGKGEVEVTLVEVQPVDPAGLPF